MYIYIYISWTFLPFCSHSSFLEQSSLGDNKEIIPHKTISYKNCRNSLLSFSSLLMWCMLDTFTSSCLLHPRNSADSKTNIKPGNLKF